MKPVTFLLFILFISRPAFSQSNPVNEQELLALERQWAKAVAKNDVPTLQRLFADDVMVIASNGKIRTKQEEIENMNPPSGVTTDAFDIRDLKIRFYGEAIVVTGKATLKATARGAQGATQFLYTHVYTRRGNRWQITLQQFTHIMKK